MSEWEIKYRAGGTMVEHHRAWCSDAPEFHSEWMEEEYVTVSVRSSEPVDFQTGDFITYRDDEYFIDYDPSVIKASRRHASGDSFRYDNIKFVSQSARLKHIYFLDFVLNDNNVAYSHQPKFSFFCSSVEDLADRLQANIDRGGIGTWKVLTPNWLRTQTRCGNVSALWAHYFGSGGDYGTWGDSSSAVTKGERDQNLDVSNRTCWEELKESYYTFGLPYFCVGAEGGGVIIIGAPAVVVGDKIFRYGKGRGLYEIERHADTDKDVVTKLYAYGSEKNLPVNYYANLYNSYKARVVEVISADWQWYLIDIPQRSTYFSNRIGQYNAYTVNVSSYNSDPQWAGQIPATIPEFLRGEPVPAGKSYLVFDTRDVSSPLNVGDYVYFNAGIVKTAWPTDADHMDHIDGYPALLSINKLMLPGFPRMSLHNWVTQNLPELLTKYTFSTDPQAPWIMSRNAEALGIIEGVVNYDGSEQTEIYPTIANTDADYVTRPSVITDNGYDPSSQSLFTIEVSDGGLDWNEALAGSSGDVAITMTSGYCTGRDFKVSKVERNSTDDGWSLTLERHYDNSLNRYFPYHDSWTSGYCQIRVNDTFVVTGIEMPSSYIEAAAERMLIAACGHLDKIDHFRYTYVPKIDEIEMARQHDAAVASGGVSIHDTIKAGMTLTFQDDDLGIDRTVYIDTLTIKECGNADIPTYDVVLRNEKQKGKLEQLTEKISDLRIPVVPPTERQTRTLQYVEYLSWDVDHWWHCETVNPDTDILETSDVWHLGCKWRCLYDGTKEEPFFWNCTDWQWLEGNRNLSMVFTSSRGYSFRPGDVNTVITPYLNAGYNDITSRVADEYWSWTRETESGKDYADTVWDNNHTGMKAITLTNNDMPLSWSPSNKAIFTCTVTVNDGENTVIVENQVIA